MNWPCRIGWVWLHAWLLVACLCVAGTAAAQTAVESGRAWLITQVRPDGNITGEQSALATGVQTRFEVLETLRRLGVDVTAIGQGLNGVADEPVVEHRARRLLVQGLGGITDPALLAQVRSAQQGDGGFAGTESRSSNVLDTSFALLALRATGEQRSESVGRGLSYLAAHVADLDQPGWTLDSASQPYVAAYLLLTLQSFAADYPMAASIDQATAHLLALQGTGVYAETLLNAIGAIALGFSSTTSPSLYYLHSDLRDTHASPTRRSPDPYLTALALRGLINAAPPPPPVGGRLVAT
ncbi:MAG: hypothetical protein KDI51_14250, partial [Xanthomonadales bacterium]|nr:hypothetical protein [Xanthomonadales bacterium]